MMNVTMANKGTGIQWLTEKEMYCWFLAYPNLKLVSLESEARR
jgi:hypothetical protein